MNSKAKLIEGPVAQTFVSLTGPMIFAMLSMVVFNLVDTFFVAQLGTTDLAAMGFIFPVVMFITSVALGFGVATSSVVSRAIGEEDFYRVRRLTTDSLLVSLLLVAFLVFWGWLTMDGMFRWLGAEGEPLILVKQYMRIWYLGVVFVVVPMVGNNAIRACGDTLSPSLIMMTSMIINAILDPLLIFGLWGFPRLELKGAAIATVVARALTMIGSLLVLHFKVKLIDWHRPAFRAFTESVRQIFYIGVPTAASRLLMPVTMAIIMRLVAQFGPEAVAAFGVTLKIEMFVFVAIMALFTVLIPFIGQNWGAKKFNRVKEAVQKANIFSLLWGKGAFILFFLLAIPFGHLFGKDINVKRYISLYLQIIPVSYGLRGCAFLVASVFNAINKPFMSTALNLTRMFVFYIPFALLGSRWGGLTGLLFGLCLANMGAGGMSLLIQ